MIMVTGSNFVLDWLAQCEEPVINLYKLTYAGNLENLASLAGDARHAFVQGNLGDRALVDRLLAEHRPRAVINFAAESHVDRSIHGPEDFIQTNIVGTFRLLDELRPKADGSSYASQITYVTDRSGHDRRYAIDARKIERELGWKPAETFETGIRKTVPWYQDNPEWVANVQSGAYLEWVAKQYQGATQ